MGQKIRISKSGFNVLTETDTDNIVYDSDYDTLKYYTSGYVNVTPVGADKEETVAHNLGYIPFFIAYVNNFSPSHNMCPGEFDDTPGYVSADAYADSSNLYFKIHTDYNTATFNFRYFIFRNSLGL